MASQTKGMGTIETENEPQISQEDSQGHSQKLYGICQRLDEMAMDSPAPIRLVSYPATEEKEEERKEAKVTMAKTEKQVISGGYHRPVCPKCHCELRPERNGVGVLDYSDNGAYELYDADLWKCPICWMEVVGGFGQGPISAHYESDFQKMIEHYEKKDALIKNTG